MSWLTGISLDFSSWSLVSYRGIRTRMVYLDYITCLRYTILVRNPRHVQFKIPLHPYIRRKQPSDSQCEKQLLSIQANFTKLPCLYQFIWSVVYHLSVSFVWLTFYKWRGGLSWEENCYSSVFISTKSKDRSNSSYNRFPDCHQICVRMEVIGFQKIKWNLSTE